MRKFQQIEILYMLNLLDKAYKEINDFVALDDKESVIILLTDCQEAMINIGTFIEAIEEDAQPIITKLEQYCEMVYQTSLLFDNKSEFHNFYKEILDQHQKIEQEIHQFTLKKEIVFLPYKAAMWDSLESIWLSAKDDKDCECYIMPIPYFEWDKGEKSVTTHYEGDMMPDYVKITHYQKYDIKSRKPDVIYFHNPYDSHNLVTSVHPDYFSPELKKHTELLVYVPYFATGGDLGTGFFELPSYYQSDKIVIQSDSMRQFYSENIPDNKFMVLGSPKFDRIIYYNKNKPELPVEWVKIIKNRKVVFFNTSITSLLEYNDKALKKIEYILTSFKDREAYVLLWRPHPLTKATLYSLRPNLLEEYLRLERMFIDGQWGIYDNTADVTMSVVLSDAYIGEESSSIVHLFGVTGKPIFIWNMNITKKISREDKSNIFFYDFYVDNDELWFISAYTNILCRMCLKNQVVKPIQQLLPGAFGRIEFLDVIKDENFIYVLPYQAEHLCVYNLKDKTLQRIPIPNSVEFNFDRMISYKDYIFLKPKCYPAIVRYNKNDGSMVYHSKCLEQFIREDNLPMFSWEIETRDNLLFMASCQENKVLEFNMDNGDNKVHVVGSLGKPYFSMNYDGHDYWLLSYESSSIVRWNYETGKITEYKNYPKNFKASILPFVSLIQYENFMFAFPSSANMILRIDIKTGEVTEFNEGNQQQLGYQGYLFAKRYDASHVIAVTAIFNQLVLINLESYDCQIIKCKTQAMNDFEKAAKKFYARTKYYPYAWWESGFSTMEDFLDDIAMDNLQRVEEQKLAYAEVSRNLDGTCGAKIHTKVMEEINKKQRKLQYAKENITTNRNI